MWGGYVRRAQVKAELAFAKHLVFPAVGSHADPRAEAMAQVHAQVRETVGF
jgi:hypothetical protein